MVDIHEDHFYACPFQKVDAVGETVLFPIDDTADACLDDEFGTL